MAGLLSGSGSVGDDDEIADVAALPPDVVPEERLLLPADGHPTLVAGDVVEGLAGGGADDLAERAVVGVGVDLADASTDADAGHVVAPSGSAGGRGGVDAAGVDVPKVKCFADGRGGVRADRIDRPAFGAQVDPHEEVVIVGPVLDPGGRDLHALSLAAGATKRYPPGI